MREQKPNPSRISNVELDDQLLPPVLRQADGDVCSQISEAHPVIDRQPNV
jgi:hypothetical protein